MNKNSFKCTKSQLVDFKNDLIDFFGPKPNQPPKDSSTSTTTTSTRKPLKNFENYAKIQNIIDTEQHKETAHQQKKAQKKKDANPFSLGCNPDHSAEYQLFTKSDKEKKEDITYFKSMGDGHYKQKRYSQALFFYKKALLIFTYVFPKTTEKEKEFDSLKLKILLNKMQTQLNLGLYRDAVDETFGEVMSLDSKNPKAFFRKCKGFLKLGLFDEARGVMTECAEVFDWKGNKGRGGFSVEGERGGWVVIYRVFEVEGGN